MFASLTPSRGRIAALLLTSQLAIACDDDGGGDEAAGSSSTASTDTDPSSESTDTPTDPSADSGSSSSTSSTDPTDDGSSGSGSDDAGSSGTSSDDAGSSDSGSETAAEQLAILGDWTDGFGGVHMIGEAEWVQTYGRDSFVYGIDHFDNEAEVVVAQSQDDDTWSRFDWTFDGEQLYYCQTAYGLDSAADADATPRADDADPANAGCGGFSWSALTPG